MFASLFLFSIDQTLTAVIQPQIFQRFGEPEKLPWLAVSYMLGNAAVAIQWYVSVDELFLETRAHGAKGEAIPNI